MPKTNKKYFLFLIFSISLGLLVFSSISSANPAFNFMSNDLKTLTLENRTTNPGAVGSGSANWRDPISASAGDAVSFRFYYHNGVDGTVANNVRLRINYPTSASTNIVSTGVILSDNAVQVSDTATINVSSNQTLIFENTAKWYPNQQTSGGTDIAVVNTGSSVEVNIGNVAGGWPSQGNVVFRATISNNSPVPTNHAPIVSAGAAKNITSGQSVTFGDAAASDPDGDSITYSWSCTGGTLSSNTVLNPTYTAPSVSSATNYTCTLTATDIHNAASSDSLIVNVSPAGSTNHTPIVNAGSNKTVTSAQSITFSDAAASDLDNDPLTYSWSCTGGTLSSNTVLNPTYTAPSVSSATNYTCTLTATDSHGAASSDILTVSVLSGGGGGGGSSGGGGGGSGAGGTPIGIGPGGLTENHAPIVHAGSAKTINSAQSINFSDATSSDPDNDTLSYLWNCNGGILSNNTALNPIYTAPTVSGTINYTCTLAATDSHGASTADSLTVNVSPVISSGGGGSSSGGGSAGGGTVVVLNNTGLKVTTNNASNITTNSATIKGTLNSDDGQNTSLRFDWGRTTSYDKFSNWFYNKRAESVVTSNLSGLEKGKAYHFRIEAINGKEGAFGQDLIFITKPDPATDLNASTISASEINLNWNKGDSSCYTMIIRKKTGYPVNTSDGVIAYYDKDSSSTDKNLEPDTTYYYRAWAVGCDGDKLSFSDSPANAEAMAKTAKEPNLLVETLARNLTQGEIAWHEFTSANPFDEVEFNVIVTATGTKPLVDVVVKNILPRSIGCIYDLKVDGNDYNGTIDAVSLGNLNVGQSRMVSFTGRVDSEAGPNCATSSNSNLISSVEVSAKNADLVKKYLNISMNGKNGNDNSQLAASIMQLLKSNTKVYYFLLILAIILIVGLIIHLIMDRKKRVEGSVRQESAMDKFVKL